MKLKIELKIPKKKVVTVEFTFGPIFRIERQAKPEFTEPKSVKNTP